MSSVLKDFRSAALSLVLPIFAMLAIGGYFAVNQLKERIEDEARISAEGVQQAVESAVTASFTQMLQTTAARNLDLLTNLHRKQQAGTLTQTEAQSLALEALAVQKVGSHGYLFTFNSLGTIQGHPDKALVNTPVKPPLRDQLRRLKPGELGQYEGYLPQNSSQQPLTLYKTVFAPWDWTIALVCSAGDRLQMAPLALIAATIGNRQSLGHLHPFFLDQRGQFYPSGSFTGEAHGDDRGALPLLAAALRRNKDGILNWPLTRQDQSITDSIFVFRPLPALDLLVGVHGPSSAVYQPLTEFRQLLLFFFSLLLLAALATLFMICRRRSAILKQVAQTLTTAKTDPITLPHGSPDELSLITTVFNRLRSENRQFQEFVDTLRADTDNLRQQLHQEAAERKRMIHRLQAETATRTSAEKYLLLFKGIFDNAIEGIYITDREGRILSVNQSFARLTGYQPAEVIGKHPNLLNSSQQDSRFYQQLWRKLRANGSWTGEVWNQNKDGAISPQWLSISAIKNDRQQVTHYFAFFHDISELKRKEKQISIMAYSDALTKLPNRAALEFRLTKAIARAERDRGALAIFFIDLDNFKNINDSLGHDKGDQVLIEVANRLMQTIRSEDTLCRLGGDEFILLSENIENDHSVYMLANRILTTLQRPIEMEPNTIYMNASIGISLFPEDGQTTQELIKNADMAMYKAKSEGKNKFVMFTREMNDKLLNRVRIEHSIRTGLERREFIVYYQPKIELQGEQPTSFEALIRWRKDGQILAPEQFIPIAEEAGLIDEMSLYVLDEVCLFLCRLQEHNIHTLPISINMSPRTFNNRNIVATIDNILAIHKIDHHLIEFEITETTAMKDVQHTLATMQSFRQRGIRFSIDDFGTGYSSLSYLSEMPVSTLKIDKRFIGSEDANSRSIVSTITAMSKQMRLKVVAEGVETLDQLQWLREIGCDEVQGFYFCRPMPAQDTHQYLLAGATPVVVEGYPARTTTIH